MRTAILATFAALFLASAARADDTKPPQIADVKASSNKGKVTVEARITDETGVLSATVHHRSPGGKVEDTPMVKNDYDDVFKASFNGGGETEYWIDSSDLLGNGPSTYGSSSKAYAVGGAKTSSGGQRVAKQEEPKQEEPKQEEPKPEPAPREHHERVAKAPQAPVIEHRKPSIQPPEGKDFTLRIKIKSESPVAVAILQAKPEGGQNQNIALKNTEGDSYEGEIPAALAHGNVDYWIAAKNQAGQMTRQGDGSPTNPYVITFKAAAGSAAASSSSSTASSGATASAAGPQPYTFTDLPPYRVPPSKPFTVRAQVVPSSDDGAAPDKVAILWRGADAQDQFTEMVRDDSGGLGGYKAELPEQPEGAVFFQIVACDAQAAKCGIDTGSKHKWHATIVSAQPGAAQPMALDAVSTKGPPSLPE